MLSVVRIKGSVRVHYDIEYTLRLLRLSKINHCVVVDDTPYFRGMIQKVKDYVAWGEIDEKSLVTLLENRGRLSSNRRLTTEFLEEHGFESFKDLASKVLSGETTLKGLISPVFRLHPPRKGHRGIKQTRVTGGVLGFHQDIGELLQKMR